MSIPRDMHSESTIGIIKIARIFSNVISPPVMFALLGLAFAVHETGWWPGFGWAVLYGFWIALAPILFVLYMLQTGRIKELHMSDTSERHLPYLVAVICSVVGLLLLLAFDGPILLICLAIFNIIELSSLGLINIVWLISIHATGMMATVILTYLVFGVVPALALIPVLLLVCWARLFLKRHTPWQVVGGLALGVVSVWVMVVAGCF